MPLLFLSDRKLLRKYCCWRCTDDNTNTSNQPDMDDPLPDKLLRTVVCMLYPFLNHEEFSQSKSHVAASSSCDVVFLRVHIIMRVLRAS